MAVVAKQLQAQTQWVWTKEEHERVRKRAGLGRIATGRKR